MYNRRIKNSTHQLSRPASTAPITYDSLKEDRSERLEVINKLKVIAGNLTPSEVPGQWHAQISLKPGSALEQALKPAVAVFREMVEQTAFKQLMAKLQLPEHAEFELSERGEISARFDGRSSSFSNAQKLAPGLKEEIDSLIDMAELTGGAVTLGDRVNIVQWLKFHQFTVPQTGADAQKLIAFLEYQFPTSPTLGSYWEMLVAKGENPAVLQEEQRSQVRALTRQYVPGKSLLEHLIEIILGGRNVAFNRTEAEATLLKIVSSPVALIFANGYIKDLGWFGAKEDQSASSEYLQEVLLTAVLLDLHPLIGEEQPRNHIVGFNLYAAEHTEMSFADVQTKFERYLVDHCAISDHIVALVAHLLLAGAAPEFLVKDLPITLVLGTPQWVDYCRAVAVAEFNEPGTSRTMSYGQIETLLMFDSVSEPQQTLHTLASVDPVIDWALLNSIVTPAQVTASIPNALEIALAAYSGFAQKYADTSTLLARPLPTRKAISLDILEQVARGCTYLEDEVLYQQRNKSFQDVFVDALPMSMVELHMSNDLATGDWDLKKGTSVYKAFPKMLPQLISPEGEFYRQFNRNYPVHADAMATHLELAFTSLPLKDRTRLLRGEITLFTVRPSVASTTLPGASVIANPVTGFFIRHENEELEKEKQKAREAATGRYGVVICTVFENQLFCYELFSLHGKCRENPKLGKVISDAGLLGTTSGFDISARYLQLPTDIECYTHAVIPGVVESSGGVIERLAVLPAVTDQGTQTRSYYQSFYAREFKRLGSFVLKHRPIATYEELVKECWGQTKLEKLRAQRESDLDTFLNIVVPFKSCIEDLVSGDSDRQISAAPACVIEVAMTLLLVVGTAAKIVSILAKSATLASKSIRLAKISVGLLNNLLNPVDGVPQLLKGGGRLLHRGVRGVWHAGRQALETATFQVRRLTGNARPYDLIKAADRATIGQGIWRPVGTSTESLMVLASRHDDGWYALNRRREPWGAKLRDIDFRFKLPRPHWHKIFPKSYSRLLVKKGVPLAKTKVDDAISVLNDPNLVTESNAAMAMLLADDSVAARNTYRKYLTEVGKDLSDIKPANVIYDNTPQLSPADFAFGDTQKSDTLAELHWGLYQDWKVGDKAQHKNNQFLRIYTENFNDTYRKEHLNPGTVADVLVHELFHGYPGTKDTAYGELSGLYEHGMQQLDVSSLLNLGKGKLTMKLRGYPDVMWNPKVAFKTADAFALTTSLLGQLKTNRNAFEKNIAIMKAALRKAGDGVITEPTVLALNIL